MIKIKHTRDKLKNISLPKQKLEERTKENEKEAKDKK